MFQKLKKNVYIGNNSSFGVETKEVLKIAPKKFLRGNKAQIGIGTLIIFIAMVLVAAVTAGVLMRTSENLESKATATGESATKEISTTLKVINVMGYNYQQNSTGSTITKLIITVTLGSGSSELDFDSIVLSYASGDVYIRGIRYNSSIRDSENSTQTDDDIADFGVVPVYEITQDSVLQRNEIVELHFWIEDNNGVDHPLSINQEFSITLMPIGGTPITIKRVTPSAIRGKYIEL